MTTKSPVTPREFVTIWQTSDSLEEVAQRSGIKITSLSNRANAYRKKGVPLKYMGVGRPGNDWNTLKELAESLQKEGNE